MLDIPELDGADTKPKIMVHLALSSHLELMYPTYLLGRSRFDLASYCRASGHVSSAEHDHQIRKGDVLSLAAYVGSAQN